MDAIIDIVLPVFCLIGFGYLATRSGYLSEAAGDGLATFVLKLAIPVFLFRSIATAQFTEASPWEFLAVYFSGIICAWIAATLIISQIFKRGYRASVIGGVSASFSNLVLLGIPLVERAYGPEGLQILFLLLAIHLPAMMTISTFLLEHAVRADGVESSALNPVGIAKNLIRNLAVNPIIIAIAAGLLWRLTGLSISGLPGQVMTMIAVTTGPLALFSLGMGLVKYDVRGNLAPAFCMAMLALIMMPAIVYLVGTLVFPLPPLWLKVAVLGASLPTGVNAYLFATYFKIAEGLATNTIVLALLGSILTIPFWLSVVS